MSYVDGYVLPLPEKNREIYRDIAQKCGEIWIEHGALAYKECIADDMNAEWAAGSFPKAVGAAEGETVIFAFVIFKSRQHRDEVNAKVHNDPRMKNMCGGPDNAPFDVSRMMYGGFSLLVDL